MEDLLTAGVRGFAEGALARPFPWDALALLSLLFAALVIARFAWDDCR